MLCKQAEDNKKFVNLLPVYTIYKQKFRRLTKEEFEAILCKGSKGKPVTRKLCEEFMKAKNVPHDIDFSKNVGLLNLPRVMPLIALLAERAEHKFKPSLSKSLSFSKTPDRFRDKFRYLMVYGCWYLGKVISDSLSVKEQVNRGNMFNFEKGDLGYWWATVKILDWRFYVNKEDEPESCSEFVSKDPPKYRYYSSRAIINMGQHPKYFLTELDWSTFISTIKSIRHPKVIQHSSVSSLSSEYSSPQSLSMVESYSYASSLFSSNVSMDSSTSRESID